MSYFGGNPCAGASLESEEVLRHTQAVEGGMGLSNKSMYMVTSLIRRCTPP